MTTFSEAVIAARIWRDEGGPLKAQWEKDHPAWAAALRTDRAVLAAIAVLAALEEARAAGVPFGAVYRLETDDLSFHAEGSEFMRGDRAARVVAYRGLVRAVWAVLRRVKP